MEQRGTRKSEAIQAINEVEKPAAFYTKMQEASHGQDTMTGHWEMMGLHIDQPFRTFPNGFPAELIQALEEKTNRKVIGNKPTSGRAIIKSLPKEQRETRALNV